MVCIEMRVLSGLVGVAAITLGAACSDSSSSDGNGAGGTSAGGSAGSSMGGSSMGGSSMGGTSMGGTSMGGSSMGGTSMGGTSMGGSSGAGGTAATSGTGARGGAPPCTDPDGVDPSVQGTTTGVNGTLTDECDASGDLTEYFCEQDFSNCGQMPSPDCAVVTGNVFQRTWQCGGTCMNGTCNGRCPEMRDMLTYDAIDTSSGDATFSSAQDPRTLECELIEDGPDPFDCTMDPTVGMGAVVTASRPMVAFCTGGALGTITVAPDGTTGLECRYRCDVVN